jgi:predicted Rossmann fold flavoprotein
MIPVRTDEHHRGKRIAIIGAGAAGLMAANFAVVDGTETLLIERTKEGGKKILISGGGRCNILPVRMDAERYVTESSRNSMRKILSSWPLGEQISFFEHELQLPLTEEAGTGKLFPASQRARDVRDRLLGRAQRLGVRLLPGTRVTSLSRFDERWLLRTDSAGVIEADAVIVATGGLSVPNTGSDGDGFRFAHALGVQVHRTYPALTPVTSDDPRFTGLAGIALDVRLEARDGSRRSAGQGALLFTHLGFSGPAVLDVSHVLARSSREGDGGGILLASWSDRTDESWNDLLRGQGSRTVAALLREELPARLVTVLLELSDIETTTTLSRLRRDQRRKLVECLCRCPLPWSGDEGYAKAEVTGGGVSLADVRTRTLEHRALSGLYFCGEVLDVFGPIGGFNFAWAWATGRAAGIAAAGRCGEDGARLDNPADTAAMPVP